MEGDSSSDAVPQRFSCVSISASYLQLRFCFCFLKSTPPSPSASSFSLSPSSPPPPFIHSFCRSCVWVQLNLALKDKRRSWLFFSFLVYFIYRNKHVNYAPFKQRRKKCKNGTQNVFFVAQDCREALATFQHFKKKKESDARGLCSMFHARNQIFSGDFLAILDENVKQKDGS